MADQERFFRIAIIGAPKTGKTRLANGLKSSLEPVLGHKPTVVDGYAQKLIRDTGFTLGHHATHSEDMMVAGVRMAEERKAINKGLSVITVGTPIDSFVYRSIISDTTLSKEASATDMEFRMGMSSMEAAALMIAETYEYDEVFYLPVDKEKSRQWERVLDDGIKSTLLRFDFPFTTINGKHNERIQAATRVVENSIREEVSKTEVPIGQSVRQGGEAGQDIGNTD